MMYEKKRYVVHILGTDYTVISDEKESHVMASAQQVNNLMTDIFDKIPSADIQKVAVFAALRIASDLLHSQAQKRENESKIEMCIEEIERALL